MKKRIYQIDAFTSTPFAGNPAGVVPDATGLSDRQMLAIAKEMRLSETAFVLPGGADYDVEVRFFTPTEEVDLCGHATIATFSLLKKLGMLPEGQPLYRQKTKAGILDIRFDGDKVIMRQAEPRKIGKPLAISVLCDAMNVTTAQVGIDDAAFDRVLVPEIWSTGLEDILFPVKSVAVLRDMEPYMDALSALSKALDVVGVHAFAFDDNGDIWCRNFAPAYGIPEESATGTSNGALGAYLSACGMNRGEDLSFTVRQGDWMDSPSRIRVEVRHNNTVEIWVGGSAVVVIEGELLLG